MNKIGSELWAGKYRQLACAFACAAALAWIAPAWATDISQIPIVTTTTGQAKPNVMLLMDASDSMAWTHMPDEVESTTGIYSVGYKSSQCNILYYDPTRTYDLPKKADGSFFATPDFNNAPYAGFGSYYLIPDTSTVNLATSFKAYDGKTLQVGGSEDTPQPAYYYKHSSGTALNYATQPCTDADLSTANSGAWSQTASDGGTWTKVLLTNESADQQKNFAVWYSFYRTRIGLIKSAASLAFTPLSDTYRVGFITVQPKIHNTDPAIDQSKYLQIDDFNSTQRDAWFQKLFSQSPDPFNAPTASPAREGLARVGRHYANKHDSINTGMAGDPMQYSCQQNFTILTTDGYWNAQTETPDTGSLHGGPLQLDGVTKVGQQDGDPTCALSDEYCPHPIYDGSSGSTDVVVDANNLYGTSSCSLPVKYRSTHGTRQVQAQWTKSFTKTLQTTQFYRVSTAQIQEATSNVTEIQKKTKQTTEQYTLTTHGIVEEHYQIKKSQTQSSKTTEQQLATSSQWQAFTSQTTRTETRQHKISTQYMVVSQQLQKQTVQALQEKRLSTIQKVQTLKHVYRYVSKLKAGETYLPSADCGPPETYDCKTIEISGPSPNDPATPCVAGSDSNSPYTKTDCTAGPMTQALASTPSCSPVGTSNSGAPNYVTTICTDDQQVAPAFVASCTPSTGSDNVRTICTYPSGPNNQTTPGVSSCTDVPNPSGPDYVHVICSYSVNQTSYPDPATYVGTCDGSSTTDGSNTTTTCSRPAATNVDTYVASGCVPGTFANNQVVTCATETTFGPQVVDPSTCPSSGAIAGPAYRTCSTSGVAPYATATNVASCASGMDGSFTVTTCTQPSATNYVNQPVPAGSCVADSGSAPPYRAVTCGAPVTTTTFVPPGSCTNDSGLTGPNYTKVTCTGPTQILAPVAVDPASCTALTDTVGPGPDYIVTTCTKVSAASTTGTCSSGNSGPPDYIQSECVPDHPVAIPSPPCTLGTTGSGGNTVTCDKPAGPNNMADVPVASCVEQAAVAPDYIRTTCSVTYPMGQAGAIVKGSDCVAGTDPGNEYQVTTCTSNPAGPYATPQFVDSCTPGEESSGLYLVTTCTTPAGPNNLANQAVATCSPSGLTIDANHVQTTCTPTTQTAYVDGLTCADQSPSSSNGYVSITCGAPISAGATVASATCTQGTDSSAEPVTTRCVALPDIVTDPSPPCTSDASAGITCTNTGSSAQVADASCQPGALGTAPFTVTECTDGAGAGLILTKTTTKTTTTTKRSGTTALATPTVSTDTGTATNVTVCLPASDPRVAIPAVNPVHAANNDPPVPSGCNAWPCTTTTTDPARSENSLADVASYYYKTDLRPDFPNTYESGKTGLEDDKAHHQHMTTFVVGLGVSGTLQYSPNYRSLANTDGDFPKIRCLPPMTEADCIKWPVWPVSPTDDPLYYQDTDNYNNPKSIDDFWHTAVNGRGTFFSAKDPTAVVTGLLSALTQAGSVPRASGSGDAASTFEPVLGGSNFVYTSSYHAGDWIGDLQAFTIDPSTGALSGKADGTPLWSAFDQLELKTGAACDSRNIYLLRPPASASDPETLVDFAWNTFTCDSAKAPTGTARTGTLSTNEKAAFGLTNVQELSQAPAMTVAQRTSAAGANLVNFIRGQRGLEGYGVDVALDPNKLYRTRGGALGDLVGSQPVYVGLPFARYQDSGYADFINANLTRMPMVYLGGNDGMLHAFKAETGEEAWAVIPSAVLPNLYKLADFAYGNSHQFYVDGSPTVGDVFDGSVWRTILVGGLNAGGKDFYAIDVTDPATPKAMWEFGTSSGCNVVGSTGDCGLGLSFGHPVITKVVVHDGDPPKWVVMLTSGYNNDADNGDGGGYLYVLDAVTGHLISRTATNAGSVGASSGLAQINNFVENTLVDNTTLRAYGGDLLGNIWHFEFGSTPSAQLLGTATDVDNNAVEPITVRPELAEFQDKTMVLVGTGRLLGTSDVTDPQRQSVYGIVDPRVAGAGPVYPDLRAALKPVLMTETNTGATAATAVRTVTCNDAAKCSRTAGWVVDLPEAGERVNVPMKLNFGTLVVGSNVPKAESCTVGGHSFFNYFDYATGLAVATAPPIDVNNPSAGQEISRYVAESLIEGFSIFKLLPPAGANNGPFIAQLHQSDTAHINEGLAPLGPGPQLRRISWREIVK